MRGPFSKVRLVQAARVQSAVDVIGDLLTAASVVVPEVGWLARNIGALDTAMP